MTFDYNENLLQFIWEQQLFNNQELITLSGESLTIVKQGILNKDSGPDFENAHIKIGKTEFYGSIEIHVNEREWLAHKHHLDKAYNNVILHVCYAVNNNVYREDGTRIPSLKLGDRIDHRHLVKYQNLLDNQHFIPCENQIQNISSFELANWLDRMIVERIEDKCYRLENYLRASQNNWNFAFYSSLVRAFGMPINTLAFEELAGKLPYALIQKHSNSIFQLEALLFGTAGLLNEQISSDYYKKMQEEFYFLQSKYKLESIFTQLKSGRMRPMNLPTIKLAQLAALFHHVPDLTNTFIQSSSHLEIKNQLDFGLSDYWTTHYTFKKSSPSKTKKLSKRFINHLVLNSIIPFLYLYETKKLNIHANKSIEHLMALPSEENNIINQWKRIGIISKSAHNSQALLHLYKSYCQKKMCLSCNIGKRILLIN